MLPSVAALATYGGALKNYGAVVDASTDRPDAGANPAYADTAAMTHTAIRAWVRFAPAGSGTPTLAPTNAHDETWNNGNNAAPTLARSGTGVMTATFPATVFDEIPANQPGANPAGYAVNLRAALCNLELGAGTNYEVRCAVTAPNVITVKTFTIGTSTPVDINDGSIIGVFGV